MHAKTIAECPVCLRKTELRIVQLENTREFFCENHHVLVFDASGRNLIRVEHPNREEGWRYIIDQQRSVDYVPQKKAWYPKLDGNKRQRHAEITSVLLPIPHYDRISLLSTSSATVSGVMDTFELVARVGDIKTPEAVYCSNIFVTEYQDLQNIHQRPEQVSISKV